MGTLAAESDAASGPGLTSGGQADGAAAEEELPGSWDGVCDWVLGRWVSVWDEIFEAAFLARAKAIIAAAFMQARDFECNLGSKPPLRLILGAVPDLKMFATQNASTPACPVDLRSLAVPSASIATHSCSASQVSTGIDAPLAEALTLALDSPADPPGAFRGTGSWLDSVAGLLPQHGAHCDAASGPHVILAPLVLGQPGKSPQRCVYVRRGSALILFAASSGASRTSYVLTSSLLRLYRASLSADGVVQVAMLTLRATLRRQPSVRGCRAAGARPVSRRDPHPVGHRRASIFELRIVHVLRMALDNSTAGTEQDQAEQGSVRLCADGWRGRVEAIRDATDAQLRAALQVCNPSQRGPAK